MTKIPKEEDLINRIKSLENVVRQLQTNALLDLTIQADKKIYFDGTNHLAYVVWDSGSSQLQFYVPDGGGGSQLAGYLDINNTGTRLDNV